jgi:hypothetical protein
VTEAPGLPAIPPSPKHVPLGQLAVHDPAQQSPSSSCAFWAPVGLAAVHASTHDPEHVTVALSRGQMHATSAGVTHGLVQSAHLVGTV